MQDSQALTTEELVARKRQRDEQDMECCLGFSLAMVFGGIGMALWLFAAGAPWSTYVGCFVPSLAGVGLGISTLLLEVCRNGE